MDLQLPSREFEGYIFDCDGTLTHNMPLHYRAWCAALAESGTSFPEELFYSWGGIPTAEIVSLLNARNGVSLDAGEIAKRKEVHYEELIAGVEPIVPVVEFARSLKGVRPMAVASGGHRHLVRKTLQVLGILDWFEAVVTVEDYANGKPAPDPFLLAAERINVPPEKCVVFEDSPTGIEAAKAAGMHWVWVPSSGFSHGQ